MKAPINETRLDEDSLTVVNLAKGKQRLKVGGLVSIYRLSNGWIARRNAPENGWSRQAYWTIYQNTKAFENHSYLGGGEGRLTRAIANTLNNL